MTIDIGAVRQAYRAIGYSPKRGHIDSPRKQCCASDAVRIAFGGGGFWEWGNPYGIVYGTAFVHGFDGHQPFFTEPGYMEAYTEGQRIARELGL